MGGFVGCHLSLKDEPTEPRVKENFS